MVACICNTALRAEAGNHKFKARLASKKLEGKAGGGVWGEEEEDVVSFKPELSAGKGLEGR